MTKIDYQSDIEIEQLWVVTEHGRYVFFSMLQVSGVLVFGLWDMEPHYLLLIWFGLLTSINFLKWMVLNHYHVHKHKLISNLAVFKHVIFWLAVVTGLCWSLCIIWFLDPAQPANVLIISITLCIEIIGAMLTWTCYLPAVAAISLLAAVPLVSMIMLHGGKTYIATSVILSILTVLGMTSSTKLAKVLNKTLSLSFENVALRQETEEKSELLATALENMSQGISMSDRHDRLRMWNQKFVHFLSAAGAKVDNNIELESLLNAARPELKTSADFPTEYHLPNGQVFEIIESHLQQGGRVITFTEISNLIKRERALEKARKEADQANAAKTRFLAAASHDLRQPIHALGLFFAELSDRVYNESNALLIAQINDSIEAINSMLNALLDVSKLDAGIVKPVTKAFALNELFTRLQLEFQGIAAENQNQLRIHPTSAIVNTDPAMLERMLRNLIGNALRYTNNGRILVLARRRGQMVEIQVLDTGFGIPENQQEEIFVEFHQLQNPSRDRRQGLGLGLAIVKRLATLLNHQIKVKSKLGQGSCFSISVPLTDLCEDTVAKPLLSSDYTVLEQCVLVIDDDISILEGMAGLLRRWGCQVMTAVSPAEAEEKLKSNPQKLDLLIIDYRLSDNLSGIEEAKNLQNRLGYDFPVLIITGDTEPDRLREADDSGYPLLHKPVQPAKLRSTLQYLAKTGISVNY